MALDTDILEAYHRTRKNKRRSEDSVLFETHWERNLRRLRAGIESRNLQPSAYTFVRWDPRPREIFACNMGQRVAHHYIDIRLRPLIEAELSDRTYNNREGYGPDAATNALISDIYEVSRGFTRDAWILKWDIQGYFPNARQDIVYEQLSSLVEEKYHGEDKDILLYLILVSVFSYPTHHCYRKSPHWKWELIPPDKSLFTKPDGIGGAIGHLIWQNAMNYYLNDLDHWLRDELQIHFGRFVDDSWAVVQNKEAFLALMPEIRRRMAEKGCRLHPKKFYCQHYTKGVEFLGTHIKMDRVYLNNRIARRAARAIQNYNKCVRVEKLDGFVASINSYLGFCKGRNAYGIARDLVDMIDPKWWEFCHLNMQRLCIEMNEGFTYRERICKKYHLKYKKKK